MIKRIWIYYLRMNYCAQKFGNKNYSVDKVAKKILFELSFSISGLFFTSVVLFVRPNALILAFSSVLLVLLLWHLGKPQIKKSIELAQFDSYYSDLTYSKKIKIYILAIVTFFLNVALIFLIPYLILNH